MANHSNEIRIYLKKELKAKIDYLSKLMNMPSSRLLRILIEEPVFEQMLDSNISMLETMIKNDNKSNQMEFDFNGKS